MSQPRKRLTVVIYQADGSEVRCTAVPGTDLVGEYYDLRDEDDRPIPIQAGDRIEEAE